ncbi:MAG: GNAT family N-acetyltransferase [Solirubrobacteraceae bacterium]
MFHDPVAREQMPYVDRHFAKFAIFLLHEGRVAAGGWGVPLAWDGDPAALPEGYRTALAASVEAHRAGAAANAFSFMAVAVAPDHDRQGLARQVLQALIERAARAGLSRLVAPIRPTWKHRYPLVVMAQYAIWTRDDGLSIDPWIRTHQRMGARILGPAPNSVVVTGTVADWEEWAGMPFPTSGAYVVPGALNLVEVDRERDIAIYREENLWLQHR